MEEDQAQVEMLRKLGLAGHHLASPWNSLRMDTHLEHV